MSYMNHNSLSIDSLWDALDEDTPSKQNKVVPGLADVNSDRRMPRPVNRGNELNIFEYRETSRLGMSKCPVYRIPGISGGACTYTAYISGPIMEVDNYVALIDTLMTMGPNDVMYIFIDSPGGYVSSGGLIASAIDSCQGNVYTLARGLCASAAALIHSSAKAGNASVSPFAVMLYHMSSHNDQGVSTKIEQSAAKQVRYVNETLLSKALADGHITQEEFARIQTGEDIIIPAAEWIRRTSNGNKE